MLKIKYIQTKMAQRNIYEKGESPTKEGLNWNCASLNSGLRFEKEDYQTMKASRSTRGKEPVGLKQV